MVLRRVLNQRKLIFIMMSTGLCADEHKVFELILINLMEKNTDTKIEATEKV